MIVCWISILWDRDELDVVRQNHAPSHPTVRKFLGKTWIVPLLSDLLRIAKERNCSLSNQYKWNRLLGGTVRTVWCIQYDLVQYHQVESDLAHGKRGALGTVPGTWYQYQVPCTYNTGCIHTASLKYAVDCFNVGSYFFIAGDPNLWRSLWLYLRCSCQVLCSLLAMNVVTPPTAPLELSFWLFMIGAILLLRIFLIQ